MSEENTNEPTTNNEPVEQSLDDFEADFFSGSKAPDPKPTEENVEDEVKPGTDVDEVYENDSDDDGNEETSEESTEDEGDDPEDSTPKKETRAEKRIRELNAKYREEERQRIALEQEIAELKKGSEKPKTEDNEQKDPQPTKDENAAPHWDDEDEDGKKKYPLGQFDPQFNADLVRFTVQEEQRKLEEKSKQTEAQQRQTEAEQALQTQWEEKLAPAQERYPDFQEKGQELINSFSNLDQGYAKYLTDTIRSIDNGPDVLYHLADNPELAHEIVNQGPALASVALGRLSAQFAGDSQEKPPTRTKVTNAPPPPPTARGSAPPKKKDLDNLDDFEDIFFKK